MQDALQILFAVNLSLLFVHEMDAIFYQEWTMFLVLKDLNPEKAYKAFLLLHIPLYALILWLLLSPLSTLGAFIVDVFLIAHFFIHLLFRTHPNNQLKNIHSLCIISIMGILSAVHFIGLLLIK